MTNYAPCDRSSAQEAASAFRMIQSHIKNTCEKDSFELECNLDNSAQQHDRIRNNNLHQTGKKAAVVGLECEQVSNTQKLAASENILNLNKTSQQVVSDANQLLPV